MSKLPRNTSGIGSKPTANMDSKSKPRIGGGGATSMKGNVPKISGKSTTNKTPTSLSNARRENLSPEVQSTCSTSR